MMHGQKNVKFNQDSPQTFLRTLLWVSVICRSYLDSWGFRNNTPAPCSC